MTANFESLIRYLASSDVVTIVTTRRTGEEIATPIWSVVVDGQPYVRSEFGGKGRWFQRATRTGTVSFSVDGAAVPARVEAVTDEAGISAVDAAYERKYARQAAPLKTMLVDNARTHTLRVTATA